LDQREPEIGCADVRLQAVLFEEHPLQGLGPRDSIFRRQRRATGDIPKNCVRLRQVTIRRDLKQWHLSIRILGKEFRRAALAFENVNLHELVRNAQARQRKANLVAIAGALHRIERVHQMESFSWVSDGRRNMFAPERGWTDRLGRIKSGKYKAAIQ